MGSQELDTTEHLSAAVGLSCSIQDLHSFTQYLSLQHLGLVAPACGTLVPHACMLAMSLSPARLFATLWIIACRAPLSMGFSKQEYWSRLSFLSLLHSSTRIKPVSPERPGRFLTIRPPGKSYMPTFQSNYPCFFNMATRILKNVHHIMFLLNNAALDFCVCGGNCSGKYFYIQVCSQNFPGSPVAKTLSSLCRGPRF